MLTGHVQGQHDQALEHLQAALQLAPEAALPKLLLGVAHLGHAMSRKVANRHMTVLTAFAYLQARCSLPPCCAAPATLLRLAPGWVASAQGGPR